jgi:mannose-1-phosphate guanylyltransferase/mannose-1-phosphate guanylyltransferase/mannose-6-phosphate isomerase
VNPETALSLQSHKYRSEHWVVVKGEAKVTIDEDIKIAREGESVYVPLGSLHRLENPNESPIIIIEVQIGTNLSEDDIVRYEDNYSRK